jgi:hypothetical protein
MGEFKIGDVVVKIGGFTKFVVSWIGIGCIEVSLKNYINKKTIHSIGFAERNFVKVGTDRRFVNGK